MIKFAYDPKNPLAMPIADCICIHCNRVTRVPISQNDLDPISVMQVRDENNYLRTAVSDLQSRIVNHAEDCLKKGVETELIKELDEAMKDVRNMMNMFGIDIINEDENET